MPGFQSTRLVTEGALEPFFFLYTDDSIQGNPETCKQSSIMLNYEVKNSRSCGQAHGHCWLNTDIQLSTERCFQLSFQSARPQAPDLNSRNHICIRFDGLLSPAPADDNILLTFVLPFRCDYSLSFVIRLIKSSHCLSVTLCFLAVRSAARTISFFIM